MGFMGYSAVSGMGVYGMVAPGAVFVGGGGGGGGARGGVVAGGGGGGGGTNPISRPSEPNARKLFVGGLHFKTDDASMHRCVENGLRFGVACTGLRNAPRPGATWSLAATRFRHPRRSPCPPPYVVFQTLFCLW